MHDDRSHEDPAKEAVEHLQNAAIEVIKATRAFLDLAEELVADPTPLLAFAHTIGDLAAKGRNAAQPTRSERAEPTVQHIRVS
jgi:hypothetical protein